MLAARLSLLACAGCLISAFAGQIARGQSHAIIADRTSDELHYLHDSNNNLLIDEPAELNVYFSAANAAGTLGPMNPTALAIRRDGLVVMGDQVNRAVYWLRDLNGDGDALDEAESMVAADATNASAVSLAFPTGVAFDSLDRVYIVNAGNASGNDGVYRVADLNGDADWQDAGEVSEFIGVPYFGPGNGPYSPQELLFVGERLCFLRNSSAALQGVIRAEDVDGNGRADDPGETSIWLDSTNASGVAITAGFAIELDAQRPRAMYLLCLASGGVDQLLRAVDVNGDGDAQDAGEVTLVWSTAESGFTSVDIASRAEGRVLVSENSGKRVIVLTDVDSDGLFTSAGERADFFADPLGLVGDVRQVAFAWCAGDVNNDRIVDLTDLTRLLSGFGTQADAERSIGDLDGDEDVDLGDLTYLLSNFAGTCLPA
jgi:hypothetical protein